MYFKLFDKCPKMPHFALCTSWLDTLIELLLALWANFSEKNIPDYGERLLGTTDQVDLIFFADVYFIRITENIL